MRQEYATLCTVSKGKLKLFDRTGFDQALTRFADGQELDLVISEPHVKRTSPQNRFFHGPVLRAFAELGWWPTEAKDMLCLQFIPATIRSLDGALVTVPGHTADLSKQQFNDLIEQCIQLAAEQGIVVQDGAEWRAARWREAKEAHDKEHEEELARTGDAG